MNKRKFVQSRRPEWTKFRKLLEKLESNQAKKMTSSEMSEYSRLMREVSNDLAIIRSREWGQEVSEYLNSLVTRGYNNFYASPPGNLRRAVIFFCFDFPRLLREHGRFFLAGWCLFFVPMFLAWGIVQSDRSLASSILPQEQLDAMESMYSKPLMEQAEGDNNEEVYIEGFADQRSFMAGFYVNNNVGIALKSFAIGILLGIGSVYTLLFNGLVIGATAGYIVSAGEVHREKFLSFVVTHGSFELTAIAVAGGAGLMLGDAVIHRGNRSLLDSLKVRGLDAVKIAMGAAFMLVIAAGIEAFWSPSPIPSSIKYLVGGVSWIFVYAWLLLAGRGER